MTLRQSGCGGEGPLLCAGVGFNSSTIPLTSSLVAQTVAIDDSARSSPFVDPHLPLLWLRKGPGLAGLGEALRLEFSGPDPDRTCRRRLAGGRRRSRP